MAERIIGINVKSILESCKSILKKQKYIPRKCPSDGCVDLHSIKFIGLNGTIVILDANPPKLPTKNPDLLHERHPVCNTECIFQGNPNICVQLNEKNKEIADISVRWRHMIER